MVLPYARSVPDIAQHRVGCHLYALCQYRTSRGSIRSAGTAQPIVPRRQTAHTPCQYRPSHGIA
eukprot:757269-Rhodomonas_salina.1